MTLSIETGAASRSQVLVLMEDFSKLNICWRDNTGHKQTRKVMECVVDDSLLQMIENPMMRGAMLYALAFTNREGLVGNVELKSSLGCSDQEMAEFKTLMAVRRVQSMNFRRAELDLFRDLLGTVCGIKL